METSEPSILISSSEPEQLARFYNQLVKATLIKGITDKDVLLKTTQYVPITFFKPSTKRDSANDFQPTFSLCFKKPSSKEPLLDLKAWINEVSRSGGKLFDGPHLEPFGAEAWMSDLEGNNFLIFVPLDQDPKEECFTDTII